MRKPLTHTHCYLIFCVYIKGRVSIHLVWCWRCWDRLIQEIKAMSKVSKIDEIHLRAVMLCMLKMGKEHTHKFLLITFLIINRFSIRKKFWKAETWGFQPYHQILCILKHVEDVEDRSSLLKGYNAMYVEEVEDENTHAWLLITSLIINGFSIRKNFGKLRLRAFQPYHQILCILKHAEDV